RVRAVALVEDADGGLVVGVGEVEVEARELRGPEQALVRDRAAGERADVDPAEAGVAQAPLDALAGEVERALERGLALPPRPPEEDLADVRHARQRLRAQRLGVDGRRAPGQHLEWA